MLGTYTADIYRRYYWYRTLRYVRYDINNGTGHFGKFGTISIPVSDTSVSSVLHHYLYRTLGYVRYDIHTGTGHFGKFGTMWMLVPPVPV